MAPSMAYRDAVLEPIPLGDGWGLRICDHAGHVADVILHEQVGHGPWPTQDAAFAAGREYLDQFAEQESSY